MFREKVKSTSFDRSLSILTVAIRYNFVEINAQHCISSLRKKILPTADDIHLR